jgi:hypothetical protein
MAPGGVEGPGNRPFLDVQDSTQDSTGSHESHDFGEWGLVVELHLIAQDVRVDPPP